MTKIKVLVVDDSAFNRVSIGKMLENIPEVEIIGYAADGEIGLRKVLELKPDLVTLDLEMPKMGGFSMLRLVMQSCPVPVLVISSRSSEGDVFKALELGAIDFVAKPSRPISSQFYSIKEDLERKIIDFARCGPAQFRLRRTLHAGPSSVVSKRSFVEETRPVKPLKPLAVVIGSSTGGPPALHQFFADFTSPPNLSFAVAQHMPPGFTRSFADRLNDHSVFKVTEATNGDCMLPGHVYICPGGRNMLLRRINGEVKIQIVTPENGQIYTPSVDVLFHSAAKAYGAELIGMILTGMGNDGASGTRSIKEVGGQVIAEAEESCVVYGMPKEAVATGCVSQIVPLSGLREGIQRRSE
ncbi:MAG: chemotaxis response regulator protein-glutamate methylesterase [Geopsychrobacter sp.]|nr:chemotaxis response regulator protein-glutamate methylesterase [Geopsychrobacter sp.]